MNEQGNNKSDRLFLNNDILNRKLNQSLVLQLQKATKEYEKLPPEKRILANLKNTFEKKVFEALDDYSRAAGLPTNFSLDEINRYLLAKLSISYNITENKDDKQISDADQVMDNFNKLLHIIDNIAEAIHIEVGSSSIDEAKNINTGALTIIATFAEFLYACKSFMSNIAYYIKDAFSDNPVTKASPIALNLIAGSLPLNDIFNSIFEKSISSGSKEIINKSITSEICKALAESATSLQNYAASYIQHKQKTTEI